MSRSVREAVVALAALLTTLAVALALDPEPGPAVLAVLLTLSLSRSQLERDTRGRLEAGVVLPVIALVGAGAGVLLHDVRWVGAAVFTAAMAISVYLRRFGDVPRRIGGLIGLPFTALLVVPGRSTDHGAWLGLLITVGIGVVAWATVTLFQWAAVRVGLLPRRAPTRPSVPGTPPRASSLKPDATTRLALQMAVAVGSAFVVGFVVFPDRWGWVVLTSLVVTLGNAGRADVVHKAVQRVIGAGLGSMLALVPLLAPRLPDGVALALIVVALFAGIVLRPFAYLWWSLCITVALALLQGISAGRFDLWQRWQEIVVGAVIAVAVAWFLLPVPSEATVRRRIADVFAALSEFLAEPGPELQARVRLGLAQLERVAPPYRFAARWVPRRWRPRAAGWVTGALAVVEQLLDAPTGRARRPLGQARRALRTPDDLQDALDHLLAECGSQPSPNGSGTTSAALGGRSGNTGGLH